MADTDMQKRFLENPEGKRKKQSDTRKRNRGLAAASPERTVELKRWAMIKESMLFAQKRTQGFTSCMGCHKATDHLELDHITPSGKGGIWYPVNAQLLCAGHDSCHARKHGVPEWSKP